MPCRILGNDQVTIDAAALCLPLADRGRAFTKTLLDFLMGQGGIGAPHLLIFSFRKAAKMFRSG